MFLALSMYWQLFVCLSILLELVIGKDWTLFLVVNYPTWSMQLWNMFYFIVVVVFYLEDAEALH